MGAVKKRATYLVFWSLTRVQLRERESSVELLHFCDNQTPLVVHTISFYLMRAIHPYLFLTWFRGGIWGLLSLAVFLHKPSGSPYLLFCPHLGIRFPIFLCQFSTLLLSEIDQTDHQDVTIRIQFAKSHFTAIFTTLVCLHWCQLVQFPRPK